MMQECRTQDGARLMQVNQHLDTATCVRWALWQGRNRNPMHALSETLLPFITLATVGHYKFKWLSWPRSQLSICHRSRIECPNRCARLEGQTHIVFKTPTVYDLHCVLLAGLHTDLYRSNLLESSRLRQEGMHRMHWMYSPQHPL